MKDEPVLQPSRYSCLHPFIVLMGVLLILVGALCLYMGWIAGGLTNLV